MLMPKNYNNTGLVREHREVEDSQDLRDEFLKNRRQREFPTSLGRDRGAAELELCERPRNTLWEWGAEFSPMGEILCSIFGVFRSR